MKNRNIYRIILGISRIKREKQLLLIPLLFLVFIVATTWMGETFLSSLEISFFSKVYVWLLLCFMAGVLVVGLTSILIVLGTPKRAKSTNDNLLEIGFVDRKGDTPLLISRVKDHKGYLLEFYSPRLSFCEYEKHREEIETALNVKIVSIDPGKDMQHVKVKAIPSGVNAPEIIRWNNSLLNQKDFVLKLGEGYFGDEEFDLAVTPHVLIGGGTGSGKTRLLKLLLVQCLRKGAEIYIADFKGGVDYPKGWHEKCSIIIDAEEFSEQLSIILENMEKRRGQLIESGTSNINEHNRKTGKNMHRIIIACDEVAEVLDRTGLEREDKEVINKIESKLSTIARQGRAFGIHLIFATQRPDADVLKGQIKNNIGMRICGRADKVLSQIILDNTEASDKITSKDQGMFLTNTGLLFKAYYADDECLEGEGLNVS